MADTAPWLHTPEAKKKSAETRKLRTSFAKQFLAELELDLDEMGLTADIVPPEAADRLHALGIKVTPQSVMVHQALYRAMISGDVEYVKFARDTVGEKPTDTMEIGGILDKPIEALDLSKLSDDQLRQLMADRQDKIAARAEEIADENY